MTIRRIVASCATAIVLAAAAAPALASAEPVRSLAAQDVLADAQLVRVVRAEKLFHKVTFQHPAGVELFVPAAPGLTAAWIARASDQHTAALVAAGDTTSPLTVEGVRMQVKEGRNGYYVSITAPDRESAAEVIRRAEQAYTR